MSEEQKKLLETQLWAIANELRGKMDADEFRDYILGFMSLSDRDHPVKFDFFLFFELGDNSTVDSAKAVA